MELFDYYNDVSNDECLRQKQALQILLDTKYVTLLMVPRENKKFVDKSTQICDNIQSKIDPFDLDVFYPFIHANVKKSAQRTQVTLLSHSIDINDQIRKKKKTQICIFLTLYTHQTSFVALKQYSTSSYF